MRGLLRPVLILVGAFFAWFLVTDHIQIWPVRNTIDYFLVQKWWSFAGEPLREPRGKIEIRISDVKDKPIPQAVTLVSEWDGTTSSCRTNQAGICEIASVPAGFYRVAAVAPGFAAAESTGLLRGIAVRPGFTARTQLRLKSTESVKHNDIPIPRRNDPQTLICTSPVAGAAIRETLDFESEKVRYAPVFLYRPEQQQGKKMPILLTVYPGPVDTWECVSIGLAQAGYAVLAVGPEYSMDLSGDVEQLSQLLQVLKKMDWPELDNRKIGALAGSYSALILQQLVLRNPGLDAIVLLGPPTNMFDFRRRFEREGFLPPFGLDKALVAMGLPSREPLRYLENSMVYHVKSGLPPTLLFHSFQDEIVPYQQSCLLAEAMQEKGIKVELHLFEGASHYLLEDGDASMQIYRQTLDFLARHQLPPLGK